MARIRYLKPEFFFDDDLAELNFACRLVFQGLWCYADREGRLEDKPKVLKAQIMPYDTVNFNKILDQLSQKFITRYTINDRKYIQINNFGKHQKPHHTEKESTIPESNGVLTVKEPSSNTLKDKEKDKDKDKDKEKYGDFVLLAKIEYERLVKRFGEDGTKDRIDNLNEGIGSKGYKYDSHYHTILSWERKNNGTGSGKPKIAPWDELGISEEEYIERS